MRHRSLMIHHIGMSIAAASLAVLPVIDRMRLDRERTAREREAEPHGPEVSRQVRRAKERQQMKRKK